MAVTALSVTISCSRSAGSPGSLVTMPEVMIITEGFNPRRAVQRYTNPEKEEEERVSCGTTERDNLRRKREAEREQAGRKRGGKKRAGMESRRR